MKNEVVAYLLMEATTDPVKPTNLQVFDKNSLFYVRFNTVLQDFNVQNRNKRIYMLDPMITSLNAPHIQELILNKSWFGEAGHPDTDEARRILTINPNLMSHKINSFNVVGTTLKGEVETLDDDGPGRKMTKCILQGMEPAFSLRALAQLMKRGDGTQVMNSRAHIVTYDWVILPSHKAAYRDKSQPIQRVVKDIQATGNSVTESALHIVQESQITDYIKMESKNYKLISNLFDVVTESMTLSADLKHVIVKEGSNTYFIQIEEKIKRDVSSYMRKL